MTIRITLDGTKSQISAVLSDIERSLEINGGGDIQLVENRFVKSKTDSDSVVPTEIPHVPQSP